MGQSFFQVDAFTSRPFKGNPAAVVPLDRERDREWMQAVAAEMSLSETAFLEKAKEGYTLRWFTPMVEAELCGHATLAAAHVLWEEGRVKPDKAILFNTVGGRLEAVKQGGWIELDFPSMPAQEADPPAGLEKALGVKPVYVGSSGMDYLVELGAPAEVRGVTPDFEILKKILARGFIVTGRTDTAGYDFISRFFAPAVGILEDPVTGSAHCTLGPYWAEKLGKSTLTGLQVSSRGGVVRVRPAGERVFLGGQAVTVIRGEIIVD